MKAGKQIKIEIFEIGDETWTDQRGCTLSIGVLLYCQALTALIAKKLNRWAVPMADNLSLNPGRDLAVDI